MEPTPEEIRNLLQLFYTLTPENVELAILLDKALGCPKNLEHIWEVYREWAEILAKCKRWGGDELFKKNIIAGLVRSKTLSVFRANFNARPYPRSLLEIESQIEAIDIATHHPNLPDFADQFSQLTKVSISLVQQSTPQPLFFKLLQLKQAVLTFLSDCVLDERWALLPQLTHLDICCLYIYVPQPILSESLQHLTLEVSPYRHWKDRRWRFIKPTRDFNLPDALFGLPNLETLTLVGKRIKTLPSAVKNLKNLQKLELFYTSIKHPPEELRFCEKLTSLVWRGLGNLKKLPATLLALPKLQYLELINCPKLKLDPSFKQLRHLKKLTICSEKHFATRFFWHCKYKDVGVPWTDVSYDQSAWEQTLKAWLPNTKIILK
jgi:hypothetical protein